MKIETNDIYIGTLNCDRDCIHAYQVVKTTTKTVTFQRIDVEKNRVYWCDVQGCVEVYNFRK